MRIRLFKNGRIFDVYKQKTNKETGEVTRKTIVSLEINNISVGYGTNGMSIGYTDPNTGGKLEYPPDHSKENGGFMHPLKITKQENEELVPESVNQDMENGETNMGSHEEGWGSNYWLTEMRNDLYNKLNTDKAEINCENCDEID